MNRNTTIIAAVVVAAIVIVAGVVIVTNTGNSSKDADAAITSQLQIRGNVNEDYTIDNEDMEIFMKVLDGTEKLSDYPLADVDADGDVDDVDKKLIQDLIDRKAGTTVYVLCLDRQGNNTTVPVTYPMRDVVTYATNMQMPALYANGGQYLAGYFNSTYDVAESSLSGATDLGGTSRKISDAAWKNFTELDAKLSSGIGALLVDYSAIAQITDSRANDLNAANIPLIIYASADAEAEIVTVLTLGFLFGSECEKIGVDYAQMSWNVLDAIDKKLGSLSDSDRVSYICCTMFNYICQNDSTFNSSAATAGGIPYYMVNAEFKEKYQGKSSTEMLSTEALSNYDDVGSIINNRSMDWGLTAEEMNNLIIETWAHDLEGTPTYDFFKGLEEKLVYVNNLLPGAVKVAYMAHAMYGDDFSREWADGVLKNFIDIGSKPFEDQSIDTILAYIDYDAYKAVKS